MWSWGYDADNQLRTVSRAGKSATLAYDAVGAAAEEVVLDSGAGSSAATTRFLYDGTDLVAEYDDASGTLLRRHVHGPGMRELIREDEKRKAQDQLDALLLEGLRGETKTLTPDDWTAIRRDALAALAARKAGS